MFLCKKCLIKKEHSFFVKDKRKKYGISYVCKDCSNEYKKNWSNTDENKAKKSKYYLNNIERFKKNSEKNYKQNIENYVQRARLWKSKNLDKHANNERRRRERIKIATPKWLSEKQILQIKLFYKKRPVGMTVDHIIPIRGKNVSGLHVPWNLQYLTIQDNIKKFNKITDISGKNTDVASAMIGG